MKKLFLHYGEKGFVEILESFPEDIRKSVIDILSYENGKEDTA